MAGTNWNDLSIVAITSVNAFGTTTPPQNGYMMRIKSKVKAVWDAL
jgi:hypothetical protein